MTDEFTDRCSICHRLAYFSPLSAHGICSHCTPSDDRHLARFMVDRLDQSQFTFSTLEYKRVVRYLHNTLAGKK